MCCTRPANGPKNRCWPIEHDTPMKSEKIITSFELDLNNMPSLTAEEQAELDALAARSDSAIDYSDIPPVEDMSRFYRPAKNDHLKRP